MSIKQTSAIVAATLFMAAGLALGQASSPPPPSPHHHPTTSPASAPSTAPTRHVRQQQGGQEAKKDEPVVTTHQITLNGQTLMLDADSDAAVYRRDEDGGEICVASSLIQFLKILRTGLEMLGKLGDYDADEENDDSYDDGYDDRNDYAEGSFASGREDLLNDYLEEVESIDPDCAEAWTPA